MGLMKAKYPGRCSLCGAPFPAGTDIEWSQGAARHVGCTPFVAPADSWWISQGEGYGGTPYRLEEVICNDTNANNKAPYVVVLHAKRQHYAYDGLSFGVGDESGYIYSACVRAATDEESAPLRAQEARIAARETAQKTVSALATRIKNGGIFPPHGTHFPEGERLLEDTRGALYGTGNLFVVSADNVVWYLERHMMDGDDWGANNIDGAYMGWSLNHTEAAEQIRSLAAIIAQPISKE